jgi:hypothetical protein
MDERVDVTFREKRDKQLIYLILIFMLVFCCFPILLAFLAVNFLLAFSLIYLNRKEAHLKMIYSQ